MTSGPQNDDPLSPAMRAVLARMLEQSAGQGSRYAMEIPEARIALAEQRRWWNEGAPSAMKTRSWSIQVKGRRVGLRSYLPIDRRADWRVLYLHGGGWCVGSWRTHDSLLRRLTAALGCEVINIDYSLAPEFPFPCAIEDVRHAIDRITADGTPWVLAGDSAGANLALADSQSRRDGQLKLPEALVLFYGCFQPVRLAGSMQRWGGGDFGLSIAALERYARNYCPGPQEPPPGSALRSALFPAEGKLHGLPRTLLIAAACDPLLDQSIELDAAMRKTGADVELSIIPGVIHGFLNYGRMLPEVDASLAQVDNFLKRRG